MRYLRYCVGGAIYLSLLTATATAGAHSDLIVFGDSLSDIGNASQATFGLQPGPFYFDGRFSNGPVYSELLSVDLELGTLIPSSSGGGSYAFGGARTSGTGGLAGLFIDDIDEQVDDFLSGGLVDPDALLVMFAGANDLVSGQIDVSVPVRNLVNDLKRLIAAQARKLLVLNLPLLGLTPRFNDDPTQAATMNEITLDFNAALATALDDLETSEPNVTIFRLDVAEMINDAVADPGAFGFSNVTDPAAPGLEPGDSSYDTNQIVSEPNSHLFWDDFHPTTAAHAILAERALAAVTIVPEPSSILLLIIALPAFWPRRMRTQPAKILSIC